MILVGVPTTTPTSPDYNTNHNADRDTDRDTDHDVGYQERAAWWPSDPVASFWSCPHRPGPVHIVLIRVRIVSF